MILRGALFFGGLMAALSAFVHPDGNLREAIGKSEPILQGSGASPAVRAIVERSCQNCHSEKTEWPLYSYVAPMSWMIEKDVSEARRHMDLTNWQSYSSARRIEILSELAPVVRNRIMPPDRYLRLHPGARLSALETAQLAKWAHNERRILERSQAK